MLVLSRRINQSIIIHTSDGDIRIILVDKQGDKAKMGFIAPKTIKIMREEIDGPNITKVDESHKV